MNDRRHQRRMLQTQADAASPAKDVAGKAIGKHGLAYITVIVLVGVGASIFLDENKIAAVIGLVSAALTALIAMLAGVAETEQKETEPPEIEIVRRLIDKLDRDHMTVDVSGDRITVTKGKDTISADLPKTEEPTP